MRQKYYHAKKTKSSRKVWTALALIGCFSIFISACAPQATITCPGPDAASDAVLEKVAFNGIAFKVRIAEQNGLLPTNIFWFSKNDDKTIEYGWSEAFFQMREADATACNHPTPSQGCRQCDFCASSCNDGTQNALLFGGGNFGELYEFKEQGAPQLIQQVTNPANGCLGRSGASLPSFAPEKDSNYILWMNDYCGNTLSGQTMLARVVNNPLPIQKKLEPYTGDADPALRFKFRMHETDGKLEENFSPHLKVTKVRILLGKVDPATGREIVLTDPESLRKARPSRIMFLPDFLMGNINDSPSEGVNRCYLDAAAGDGNFDLTNCQSGGGTIRHFDTPATNVTPSYMNGRAAETLTWVIEYKLESGLTAIPDFSDGTYPILEWTIQNPM